MLSPRLGLRKRRMSLISAWSYLHPSNHGTKSNTSPNRYLVRSLSPMATVATSTSATTLLPSMASSKLNTPMAKNAVLSPTITDIASLIEEDEEWDKRLQTDWKEDENKLKQELFERYMRSIELAGPNASQAQLTRLLNEHNARLAQFEREQLFKYAEHVERQRQARVASRNDPMRTEAFEQLLLEQEIIMETLHREQSDREGWPRRGEKSSEERVREIQKEMEDEERTAAEWERLDAHLREDRNQIHKTTRQVNDHLRERREKDGADLWEEVQKERVRTERSMRIAEEAKQAGAQLHGRPSVSALRMEQDSPRRSNPMSENSSRSSVNEPFWDSASPASTAASSTFETNQSVNPSRPVHVPSAEERQRTPSGSFGSGQRAPGLGNAPSPSPLSNTPTPERWIPPDSTREPTRKNSAQFDPPQSGPTRKGSMLFGTSPAPVPSPTLDEPLFSSSPHRQAFQPQSSSSTSRPTASDPSSQAQYSRSAQPPPPPTQRPTPLPQTDPATSTRYPSTTPTRQNTYPQQQPQANPSNRRTDPVRSFTTSASYTSSSMPSSRPMPQASTSMPNSYSTSAARPQPESYSRPAHPLSSSVPNSQARPSAFIPPPTGSSYPNATKQPTSSAKPAEPKPFASDDPYRTKLRAEYVSGEEQRAAEEKRRRDQEEGARRAEEARKRGEERRRMEELAREAERREAEKRARKAGVNVPAVPDRPITEVWTAYENQWAAMANATQLRFRSIPWPVHAPITTPDQLIPVKIAGFILSNQHSQGKPRKDRLKEALLRWHPDRFESKWLKKVVEEDRELVKEGVGNVVRVLNELLNAPDFGL